MSYIAKVYLNKMFPKKGEDALHLEGDFLVLPMINVMNPITNDILPSDLTASFEVIGDDNVQIAGKGNPEATKKMKAVWVDKKETYSLDNFTSIKNKVIPVGDKILFYFLNPGWKQGEEHKLTFNIIQDHPVKFSIERSIE
jgi:hypothetical protein